LSTRGPSFVLLHSLCHASGVPHLCQASGSVQPAVFSTRARLAPRSLARWLRARAL